MPSTRSAVRLPMDGFTLAGTDSFNVQVFVPIFVSPLYVTQMMVQVPLTASGTWDASESGGVHATDTASVFVANVFVTLPKLYSLQS